MNKQMVNIDIPQDDVYRLLTALKLAEIHYGNIQMWEASAYAHKLHDKLRKQIFDYVEVEDGEDA
jgi:hypothetical protein